jgi:hypothetical protein
MGCLVCSPSQPLGRSRPPGCRSDALDPLVCRAELPLHATMGASKPYAAQPLGSAQSDTTAVILNDTSRFGTSTPSFATARAGGLRGKNFA